MKKNRTINDLEDEGLHGLEALAMRVEYIDIGPCEAFVEITLSPSCQRQSKQVVTI